MHRLLVALLLAAAALGAPRTRILIAYHSQTGNTEKLAMAVREGAASVPDVEVALRKVEQVAEDEITKADGLLVGTPVHWGNLSAETKKFIDRVGLALAQGKPVRLGEGRTGGVFCTAGEAAGGQDTARTSVIAALLHMRFVIIGGVSAEGYGTLGPQAITGGTPGGISESARADARRFGERFARLTQQLRAATSAK